MGKKIWLTLLWAPIKKSNQILGLVVLGDRALLSMQEALSPTPAPRNRKYFKAKENHNPVTADLASHLGVLATLARSEDFPGRKGGREQLSPGAGLRDPAPQCPLPSLRALGIRDWCPGRRPSQLPRKGWSTEAGAAASDGGQAVAGDRAQGDALLGPATARHR